MGLASPQKIYMKLLELLKKKVNISCQYLQQSEPIFQTRLYWGFSSGKVNFHVCSSKAVLYLESLDLKLEYLINILCTIKEKYPYGL